MRGLTKLFVWTIPFIVVFLVAAYAVVTLKGKPFIENYLSQTFNRPVTIEEVRILLPAGLRIHKINIPDVVKAEDVRLQFSLPFWYNHYLVVAKVALVKPVAKFYRDEKGQWAWGDFPMASPSSSPAAKDAPAGQQSVSSGPGGLHFAGLWIDFLEVSNGQLEFNDATQKNMHVLLDALEFKARGITYPLLKRDMVMDFIGTITNEDSPFFQSRLQGEGSLNLPARNLAATMKIMDIKGGVGLSADMRAVNNDMIVKGKINLGRLAANVNQRIINESSLEGLVYGALQASGLDINVDYGFQTKMDAFRIEQVTMSGNVIFGAGDEAVQTKIKKDLESLSKQFEVLGKQLSGENNPKPAPADQQPAGK